MRLSTKGRYAVTAMLDLALNGTQGPVTLPTSPRTRGFHCPIWSSCLPPCAAEAWCAAFAGRAVTISVAIPDEISIADIICAVDEWVEFTRCKGRQNCQGWTAA